MPRRRQNSETGVSVTQAISRRVMRRQKGKLFLSTVFTQEGSRAAVNNALCRLVKSGVLERVFRGVYMRPKQIEFVGAVRPCAVTVMKVITKARGETVQTHGAEAVRRFGLSTQMQVVPTYYTSGPTREIRVGKGRVRLRHVAPERLQHAGTKVGLALSALHYLGKNGVDLEVLSKISSELNTEELNKLLSCKLPKWMRAFLSPISNG